MIIFNRGTSDDVDTLWELARSSRTPSGDTDVHAVNALFELLPELSWSGSFDSTLSPFLEHVHDGALIVPVTGEGAKGHSDAKVFLARSRSKTISAIKVFPRCDEFVRELSALERISAGNFRSFSAPRVEALAQIRLDASVLGVLLMTCAPGEPIDQLMYDYVRSRDDKSSIRLTDGLVRTAAALAELHLRDGAKTPEMGYWARQAETLQGAVRKLCSVEESVRFTGLSPEELESVVQSIILDVMHNPGEQSILHGDASVGNVFVAPDQVTLIDLSAMHYSLNERGEGIGCAARDVVNFELKMSYYAVAFGFEPGEVRLVRDLFREAYRDAGGKRITREAERFFATRILCTKLGKRSPAWDLQAMLAADLLGSRSCPIKVV